MRSDLESYFDAKDFENRRSYWVYVFGRLAPGVTMEKAGTQLDVTYHAIVNDVEASLQEGMSDETLKRFRAKKLVFEDGRRGQSSIHGESRTPLTLLLAVTGVVLIIACANIANLLLARGAARAQEMAIRSSLGAGRHRLLVQLLTESALLAVLGGAAGLLVARWTLVFIGSLLPADALSTIQLALSPQMILFAAVLALGTGLLFGLYPALYATRPDLVTALKGAAGQPSGARAAARFRNGLVTAQIALSMALLIAAGLFIKSLVNVSRVDLGLDEDNLVTFSISPALNGYTSDQSMALFGRAEEELASLPGVVRVSDSLVPLLGGDSWGNSVRVQGFDAGPDTDTGSRYNEVGPGYFRTTGVTLLAGRELTAADTKDAPKVAVVNQAFAEKFHLDGREAVGKWMGDGRGDKLDIQIVGLAANAKYNSVKDKVPPLYFIPYRQGNRLGFLNFYLRTKGDPATVMQAVPAVVKRLDPNLPVENLETVRQVARENVFLDRLITTLAAAFAILATLLAAVGLYGVLAYSVAQRTREIGVRMALGAGGDRVRHMVLRQMGRMFVIGGLLGLAAALALGRAARSLLYELGGHDPVVLASGVGVLAIVALTAAYLPARRASKVDPMTALRQE
jgi:predicted permease